MHCHACNSASISLILTYYPESFVGIFVHAFTGLQCARQKIYTILEEYMYILKYGVGLILPISETHFHLEMLYIQQNVIACLSDLPNLVCKEFI